MGKNNVNTTFSDEMFEKLKETVAQEGLSNASWLRHVAYRELNKNQTSSQ